MNKGFKYFAFISYNSNDYIWGKRLQKRLESYKMPSTIGSDKDNSRYPMRPVFFAPTDIQPGDLTEEIQDRLRASRNLIVICSPHSAQSEWVGKEIAFFHQLGRTKNIHFFIVEGTPHSGNKETECFNPIINQLGLPEILGANIHEKIYYLSWLNKERAYTQLISKLLCVEFDSIWHRHRRQIFIHVLQILLAIIAIFLVVWHVKLLSTPVDINVSVVEKEPIVESLHLSNPIVVSLHLKDEIIKDTIASFGKESTIKRLPRSILGEPLRLLAECDEFLPIDTIVQADENIVLTMQRDKQIYGSVRFRLWHPSKTAANIKVFIDDFECKSDSLGYVSLDIPLESQKQYYKIRADIPLVDSLFIMPSGSQRVIEIQ